MCACGSKVPHTSCRAVGGGSGYVLWLCAALAAVQTAAWTAVYYRTPRCELRVPCRVVSLVERCHSQRDVFYKQIIGVEVGRETISRTVVLLHKRIYAETDLPTSIRDISVSDMVSDRPLFRSPPRRRRAGHGPAAGRGERTRRCKLQSNVKDMCASAAPAQCAMAWRAGATLARAARRRTASV